MRISVRCKLAWACALACAGTASLGSVLDMAQEANPYAVIWDRDIFRLQAEPPPPQPPPPKPPELPKVMLTGFVGKGSCTKILLAVVPKDNKEPTYYLCLT